MGLTKLRGYQQIMDDSVNRVKLYLDFLEGSDWNITNGAENATITGLKTPVNPSDAVTKAYADAVAQGLDTKNSCRVATAGVLDAYTASGTGVGKTLTADADGVLTIDGIAVALGDRVMVKSESASHVDHGIYTVTTLGEVAVAWELTRSVDADEDDEFTNGLHAYIGEGTVNGQTSWTVITVDEIIVDTTAVQFAQFSGAGSYTAGNGLTLTGSSFSVNVDDSTIEITTDALNVKAGGITSTEIATNAVGTDELDLGTGAGQLSAGDIVLDGTNSYGGSATNVMDALEEIETSIDTNIAVVGENVTVTNDSASVSITHTSIANSEAVYLNGQRMASGAGNDYTISAGTITFAFTLQNVGGKVDVVLVDYRYTA